MDLFARIEQWGRLAPERLAYVCGNHTLTYGELVRRSDALAHSIFRALPDDRSPVVVIGHKESELLVGFLGSAKAGHPYVPIDNLLPQQRIERIIELSSARLVLTPDQVRKWSQTYIQPSGRSPVPSAPYYIMFTSGSTGEPKGVIISYGNLLTFLNWMLSEHLFAEGEIFLNVVPYSFDLSVMDSYCALASGGTVCALSKEVVNNPRVLYQTLASSGTTTWVSTPSFALLCLAEKNFNAVMMPKIRRFLFCGEALPPHVIAQLIERFPNAEIWNTYGPTEATVATTSIHIDHDLFARYPTVPVGYPMAEARIVILNEAGQVVPNGERGEIIIAGPNVSPGYLGRPDLTERAFFTLEGQRAYHTGDWGYYCDDLLFFEGRIDNQIKLHGYRIELGDIEANLRALPEVQDAVVLPNIVNGSINSLTAFVILRTEANGSDFETIIHLRTELAVRLPVYMLPSKFHFLESFPLNANGKADRRKLGELLA